MTFWHPFLMLSADTPKSRNQHEALCNIVIFALSGSHFPIIFSLNFHLFSGTAPGVIFSRFYVALSQKSVFFELPSDPAGAKMATQMHRIPGKIRKSQRTDAP